MTARAENALRLAFVVSILVGCGGSSIDRDARASSIEGERSALRTYVAKVERICDEYGRKSADLSPPASGRDATIEHLERLRTLARDLTAELSRIDAPQELAAEYAEFVAIARLFAAEADNAITAARKRDKAGYDAANRRIQAADWDGRAVAAGVSGCS